eukprot:5951418-Pyramimonas_sp.AAC.2
MPTCELCDATYLFHVTMLAFTHMCVPYALQQQNGQEVHAPPRPAPNAFLRLSHAQQPVWEQAVSLTFLQWVAEQWTEVGRVK